MISGISTSEDEPLQKEVEPVLKKEETALDAPEHEPGHELRIVIRLDRFVRGEYRE